MASIFQKIAEFACGPQGRRVTEQVKRYAQDPKNQDKAKQALRRFRGQNGRGGAGH